MDTLKNSQHNSSIKPRMNLEEKLEGHHIKPKTATISRICISQNFKAKILEKRIFPIISKSLYATK